MTTRPGRCGWIVLAIAATVLAGAAGVGVGVEVARRWPIESLERILERYGITLRPIEPWSFRARAPHPRYEALATVVEGRLLVMGGFQSVELEAASGVTSYDPATNQWRRLADLPSPVTHAMAAVRDGEVWVAGGFVGDHPGPATDQVWRYLPASDRWEPGPRLPAPRGGGALVALPDGTLHYFGGWLPDRWTDSGDHWQLAPGDSTWVSRAPFPSPRGHHSAVYLDGHIYAIGGCFSHDPVPIDVALVHRYDPRTDSWSEVTPLPEPRSHAEPSTFVFEGRIYLAGGRSVPRGKPSAGEILVFDPATATWSFALAQPRGLLAPVAQPLAGTVFLTGGGEEGSNPRSRTSWAASLAPGWRPAPAMPVALGEVSGGIIGDRLYLVGEGGGHTLVLELGTGSWRPASSATQRPAQGHHHAAEVLGSELYLLGGLHNGSMDVVQVYRPDRDEWRIGPPLPYPVGSAASAVIDGRIYLAGGIVGDTTTRQAVVFDPAAGTWRALAPMPQPRNHAAAATDGERFYVFGGRGPGSGETNVVANGYADVQVYDPATDRWAASGEGPGSPLPLPQARGGMGKAVYFGGEFYVIGGETLTGPGATADGVYARVDIYDPVRNQWREGPTLAVPRHGIFPLAYGPGIWVAGGGVVAGGSTSRVVEMLLAPPPAP